MVLFNQCSTESDDESTPSMCVNIGGGATKLVDKAEWLVDRLVGWTAASLFWGGF